MIASLTVASILLGFVACAATSLALGLLAIRVLRIEVCRAEGICLGYVIGSALASTLTLALAALSLAREGVFAALGLSAAFALWRRLPWVRGWKHRPTRSIPQFFRCACTASWIVYGAIYFRYALAPEMSPDGTAYHLGLVNLWYHAHRMYRIADFYAALPDGVEMLYLFAFSIGRHSAAALVHFSFLMILPWLMVLYGVRFGISRGAAACAAILVFVTPLVGWDGSVAYNDVALAVVVFASVYLLQMWRSEKVTGHLAASSLLAGYALAIKYTGGFVLLLVAGTVIWELRRELFRRQRVTPLIVVALMALAPAPYLARNWVWYHDPLAPFASSIFRNPNFHVSYEEVLNQSQRHLNGVTWSELPRELTLGGPKLEQNLGPVYLLAPLAVLGLFWPQTRMLVIAAALVGASYAGNVSARFLIPVLPFLWMVVAFVVSRLPGSVWLLGVLTLAQLVTSLPWLTKYTHNPKIPYPGLNRVWWTAALRIEPEERYLARQSDAYVMARAIERNVPERETVLSLADGFFQSYTTRFVMDQQRSAQTENARDLLYGNRNSATEPRRRFTAVFPDSRARAVSILQTATDAEMWTITEIRLWHGTTRISPPPLPSIDAFPNPWDIGLAFDGLEATRWLSWEPMRPGMRIDVRFLSSQPIDRVDVLVGDSQWSSSMEIRIQNESGEWLCPVSARWQFDPPIDLREEAAVALKRQGVHYLLIHHRAPFGDAFRNNLEAWRLHPIVSTREATLYRIE